MTSLRINQLKHLVRISLILAANLGFYSWAWADAINVYNRAFEAHKRGEYAYALQRYNEVIDSGDLNDESLAYVYHYRGMALGRLGQHQKALDDFNLSIELNPTIYISYRSRAYVLSSLEEYDLAIQDYTESLKHLKDDDRTYHNRGIAHYNKYDFHKAIKDYDAALLLAPQNSNTYHYRGLASLALNNLQDAMSDFDAAIKLDNTSAEFLASRGDVQIKLGKIRAGIKDFSNAISLQDSISDYYLKRALAYFKFSEPDLAIADIEHGLKINPDNQKLVAARQSFIDAGNPLSKASEQLIIHQIESPKNISLASPKASLENIERYKKTGWRHYFHQDYAAALADFNKILELNPNDIYRLLTLYLSSSHLDIDPQNAIARHTPEGLPYRWPGTILKFYLGINTEQHMLNRIEALQHEGNVSRLCEINFYLGEYFFLKGDAQRATRYFQHAYETGVQNYNEYTMAVSRLKQLAAK